MSSIAVVSIALVIYWFGTCVAPALASAAGDIEEREPQQVSSYNNGLYTPWQASAGAGSSQAPVAVPATSAAPAASEPAATSGPATVSSPAPSSAAAASPFPTPASSPAPTSSPPSSSAVSSASSALSSSHISSADPDPTGREVITATATSWWALPETAAWPAPSSPASPSSPSSSAHSSATPSAFAAGSVAKGAPAQFKPIYLIPGLVLVALFAAYAVGRWMYKRRAARFPNSRSRSILTLRTDYEKGEWGGGRGGGKRDSATEELLGGGGGGGEKGEKGWMEHMLRYDQTDIFGREEPQRLPYSAPAPAPAPQQGYYAYGLPQQHSYTYPHPQPRPVPPPTPSKTSRHGTVYPGSGPGGYVGAAVARRPSWFHRVPAPALPPAPPLPSTSYRPPAPAPLRDSRGRSRKFGLHGPRPTPLRSYTLYDTPVPESEEDVFAPGAEEEEEVRGLLFERQQREGEGKTQTPSTVRSGGTSPSVYSLASPPPVGRLGGRGRSRRERSEEEGWGGREGRGLGLGM